MASGFSSASQDYSVQTDALLPRFEAVVPNMLRAFLIFHVSVCSDLHFFDHIARLHGANNEKLAEDCGWQIGNAKFVPFGSQPDTQLVVVGYLGRGATGDVHEVRCGGYSKTVAQKKIVLSTRFEHAKQQQERIYKEMDCLKRLTHQHIIRLLGAYEDGVNLKSRSICLLMYPVGEKDLSAFLEDDCKCLQTDPRSAQSERYRNWILQWLWCLSSALEFMHLQKVHHEDIKPPNIIHRADQVYFTDFSSSRQLGVDARTSTDSPASTTRMFAAPEALVGDDGTPMRHGSKTDVFSLGLVFVEMLTVLLGSDIKRLHAFLEDRRVPQYWKKEYHRAVDHFFDWFETLSSTYTTSLPMQLWKDIVMGMLRQSRKDRPSAHDVVKALALRSKATKCECEAPRTAF